MIALFEFLLVMFSTFPVGESSVQFSILGAFASWVLLVEMRDPNRKRKRIMEGMGYAPKTEALKLPGVQITWSVC